MNHTRSHVCEEQGAVGNSRPRSRFSWSIFALSLVTLALLCTFKTSQPAGEVVRLAIVFPTGTAGDLEPIIVTGAAGEGDFLAVRYLADHHVAFVYDAWGSGGPTSVPVPYKPGSKYLLELQMPSLTELHGAPDRPRGRLRIALDGRELMEADVRFHRRYAEQVYFGTNPIGASAAANFGGEIYSGHGQRLSGPSNAYLSVADRLWHFLTRPSALLGVLLLSVVAALVAPRLRSWSRLITTADELNDTAPAPHSYFFATTAFAVFVFVYVLTGGTFQLLYADWFGAFYDHQALSLLQGHLDVPEYAIGGEAFIFGGKYYGYFGPTPALLRIPLALLQVGFGHLTRILMTAEFVACLAAVYALLCHAVRISGRAPQWPSKWATIVCIGSCGLGSTLFFVSSRAYVYHEAILSGAAFGLWSAYCSLRFIELPKSRWWIGAAVCGVLAVHARPPIGLFALFLLSTVACVHALRSTVESIRADHRKSRSLLRFAGVAAIGLGGIASFNGLSYLKFKTIDGCPLRLNVQYTPERLARIDGKQFHLHNIPFGVESYLLAPTVRLVRHFPYVEPSKLSARQFPAAKIDLAEPTLAMPYSMPALSLLAVISLGAGLTAGGMWRSSVVALWIAIVPTALAMFAAIAISQRYTGDFVPFLIATGVFGIAAIDHINAATRLWLRSIVSGTTLVAIATTMALTLKCQVDAFGIPETIQQHDRALGKKLDRWLETGAP